MTESSIDSSITGDLYVSMGAQTADGAWIVRAYDKTIRNLDLVGMHHYVPWRFVSNV